MTDAVGSAAGGGAIVLKPEGDIDLVNADDFERSVMEACGTDMNLTIDLSGVTFFDSSAIAALIRCYKTLGAGRLTLIVPHDGAPRRVLDITGIDKIIPMQTAP